MSCSDFWFELLIDKAADLLLLLTVGFGLTAFWQIITMKRDRLLNQATVIDAWVQDSATALAAYYGALKDVSKAWPMASQGLQETMLATLRERSSSAYAALIGTILPFHAARQFGTGEVMVGLERCQQASASVMEKLNSLPPWDGVSNEQLADVAERLRQFVEAGVTLHDVMMSRVSFRSLLVPSSFRRRQRMTTDAGTD